MKKSLLFGALALWVMSVPVFGQEIGISSGAQLIRGELTAYGNNYTSVTSIQSFWEIPKAPNWRYGVEVRYASMSINPNFSEGWLDEYEVMGSDWSSIMSLRYYFNTPNGWLNRKNSVLFWTHFGAGLHIASYQSTDMGVGLRTGDSKQGDLSPKRTLHSGALEVGLGMQYYLTNHWSIQLIGGGQYTGNDYLDGVAGTGSGKDYPVYLMLGGAYNIF